MVELITAVVFLVISYFTGMWSEKRHNRSLEAREKDLGRLPVVSDADLEHLPVPERVEFVSGSIVLGADYFRHKLSQLVSLFGGNIAQLERLLVRARREAYLRMRQNAGAADVIADLRYETTMISDNTSGKLPVVEVYVYGTAIHFAKV